LNKLLIALVSWISLEESPLEVVEDDDGFVTAPVGRDVDPEEDPVSIVNEPPVEITHVSAPERISINQVCATVPETISSQVTSRN
jgi:hypothetical protein